MITIILAKFFYFIVVVGILIFVHELGHFLLAKKLGVGVLKFSLGFGPKLIGRKFGETEYLISAFPLGGYVKMIGEATDEDVSPDDIKRSFSHMPSIKKIAIVAAGPLFNIAFAYIIFTVVFMIGVPIMTSEVGQVLEDSPALKAGIRAGDKVLAIDGASVSKWDEISEKIQTTNKDVIRVEVFRDGSTLRFDVKPKVTRGKTIFGDDISYRAIGITPSNKYVKERSRPIEATGKGMIATWNTIELTVVGIVKIIQRKISATENIGGPILIAQMTWDQAKAGTSELLSLISGISISLGVLNLLPVPVLDGGHLAFFTLEAIIRRPLSHRFKEVAQNVGLFLLIALMVFAFWNDINRVFFK